MPSQPSTKSPSIDIEDWNSSSERSLFILPDTFNITIKKQFHPIYLLLRWIFIYTLIAVYIEIGKAQKRKELRGKEAGIVLRVRVDGRIIKRPRDPFQILFYAKTKTQVSLGGVR